MEKAYHASRQRISDKDIQTLWTLSRLAKHNKTDELEIDYAFLISQCGFNCSQASMYRYLKSISQTKIINCALKRGNFNSQKKIKIKIDFLKLNSLISPTVISNSTRQKCRVLLSRYNKEENKLRIKELEEEPKGYSSSSSVAQGIEGISKQTLVNGSLDEPTKVLQKENKTEVLPFSLKPPLITAEEEKKHYQNHRNSYRHGESISLSQLLEQTVINTESLPIIEKELITPVYKRALLGLIDYNPSKWSNIARFWLKKVEISELTSSSKVVMTVPQHQFQWFQANYKTELTSQLSKEGYEFKLV